MYVHVYVKAKEKCNFNRYSSPLTSTKSLFFPDRCKDTIRNDLDGYKSCIDALKDCWGRGGRDFVMCPLLNVLLYIICIYANIQFINIMLCQLSETCLFMDRNMSLRTFFPFEYLYLFLITKDPLHKTS